MSNLGTVEGFTFFVAGLICLGGAMGVVALRNPVHNALSLVATLFGVAVLFVAQGAYFLAAIQVIVYAGAIVVLFLFVIMLLGVDETENLEKERDPFALGVAAILGAGVSGLVLTAILTGIKQVTGAKSVVGPLDPAHDLNAIGEVLFTKYAFAFEITSLLLTIAVVGAVVLSRRGKGGPIDLEEFPASTTSDVEADA